MGEVSARAQRLRRAREDAPQLVINPDRIALDPEKIVVKHTDDGGYFCLGLGPSAEFLRMLDLENADEPVDLARSAIAKTEAPLLRSSDPFLRRLGTAVALAKDYDPNQPRDDDGRWTSEGASGAASSSVADSVIAPQKLVPALQQFAANVLAGTAGVATNGATVAEAAEGAVEIGVAAAVTAGLSLGLLVLSTSGTGGGVATGTVADAPDLGYSFDHDTDVLTLTKTNADGSKDIVFQNIPGPDGVFRDKEGNAVGRRLDGSIVIDPDAVPGYESRARDKDRAGGEAGARTDAKTDTDEPKVCPAPTEESTAGRSDRAIAYQSQISGLPPGLEVKLNGVRFDGCRESGNTITMLEAKGPGFIQHMDGPANWRTYYTGLERTLKQMDEQSKAAGSNLVEWHVAEEPFANFLRAYAERNGYANIVVIHTPAVQP